MEPENILNVSMTWPTNWKLFLSRKVLNQVIKSKLSKKLWNRTFYSIRYTYRVSRMLFEYKCSKEIDVEVMLTHKWTGTDQTRRKRKVSGENGRWAVLCRSRREKEEVEKQMWKRLTGRNFGLKRVGKEEEGRTEMEGPREQSSMLETALCSNVRERETEFRSNVGIRKKLREEQNRTLSISRRNRKKKRIKRSLVKGELLSEKSRKGRTDERGICVEERKGRIIICERGRRMGRETEWRWENKEWRGKTAGLQPVLPSSFIFSSLIFPCFSISLAVLPTLRGTNLVFPFFYSSVLFLTVIHLPHLGWKGK